MRIRWSPSRRTAGLQPPSSYSESVASPAAKPHRIGNGSTFALTFGTNAAIGLMGAIAAALTARLLGAHGQGELAAIQVWPGFFVTIAGFGMMEALSYFAARDPLKTRSHLTTGLLVSLTVSIICMTGGYFLLPPLLHSKGAAIVHDTQAMLAIIPLMLLASLPGQALRGAGDYVRWNLFRFLPTFGWMAVVVIATILLRTQRRVITPGDLAGALVVETGVVALPVLLITYSRLKGSARPTWFVARPLTRYGLPAIMSTLPSWLNLRLDQLIMASFIAPNRLGLYAAAVAWAQFPAPILNAFGSLVLPRLASERERLTQHQLLPHASRLGVLLAVAISIPAVALTPLAITVLFGNSFTGAVPSAMILVVGGSIIGLNYILSEALLGLGCAKGPARAQVLGLVVTVATLAALLPLFGIVGAALSSIAGYGTTFTWLTIEARRETGVSLRTLILPEKSEFDLLRLTDRHKDPFKSSRAA